MNKVTKRMGNMVFVLFGISIVLRFLLANFYPRTINCYPDEFLYLSLGESIWNNHQLMTYNLPTYFNKIGYSLFLAPAFAITDIKLRGVCIAFVNAVLVSLGVFPVYGLAKSLLRNPKLIILSVVLYMISPTLTYSMTYMSEVLYTPLALMLIYVIYSFFREKEVKKKSILLALACLIWVLAFLTKSQAVIFPVAFLLCCLITLLRKEKTKNVRGFWGIILLFLVLAVVGAYLMTHINSQYYQLGIDVNILKQKGTYIAFGSLFYLLMIAVAFCVIPMVLPGVEYRKLNSDAKNLYRFLISLILVTVIVVSYMIMAVEDYPSMTPRAHIRYVEYAFVPFVIVLFHLMEQKESLKRGWRLIAPMIVFSVLLLITVRGFAGQTIDQTMLFYWQVFAENGSVIAPGIARLISGVLSVVAVVFVALYGKNKAAFAKWFAAFLICMCIGNSALSVYVQYKTHTHSEEEMAEMEQMREFVISHASEGFLVLEPVGQDELLDTYLIDCENVRTGLQPDRTNIQSRYEMPSDVCYIIVHNVSYCLGQGAEVVQEYPNMGYTLYQVTGTLPEITSL
ncbi:MAG: glycosyltransferase family 39 protein [Lachnospiraceae bacterium]|nr:glycosyltransferase family 39 protein [Lachnospiraceae bacterium]